MVDRLPPGTPATEKQDAERIKRLKQASRMIVTSREKMPHSARWRLALSRTLWRYSQQVLRYKKDHRPDRAENMEERQ